MRIYTKIIIIPAQERAIVLGHFWSKVPTGGADDCWPWTGEIGPKGYGRFYMHRKRWTAHRIAYFLFYGEQPDEVVRHTCDNPPCCNPAHLRSGTNLENITDMFAKGRNVAAPPVRFGERNGKAKLTASDILRIRQMRRNGLTLKQVANEFNVSYACIQRIDNGTTWQHISELSEQPAQQ